MTQGDSKQKFTHQDFEQVSCHECALEEVADAPLLRVAHQRQDGAVVGRVVHALLVETCGRLVVQFFSAYPMDVISDNLIPRGKHIFCFCVKQWAYVHEKGFFLSCN
jgi:hypothetical protein